MKCNEGGKKRPIKVKKQQNPPCNNCGSNNVIKNGARPTKAGKWQNYLCNKCGHRQRGELIEAWEQEV